MKVTTYSLQFFCGYVYMKDYIVQKFIFNAKATHEIYTVRNTLSLHDALPIYRRCRRRTRRRARGRTSILRTTIPQRRSEEHTSELQSLRTISYAVFCLKK